MQIELINDENMQELQSKKIYCFGLSYKYIDEMIQNYQVKDSIVAVYDNNPKLWGETTIGAKSVPVFSPDKIARMNFDTEAIVITNGFGDEIAKQLREKGYEHLKKLYIYATYEDRVENFYLKEYREDALEDIIVFRSGPQEYVEGTAFYDNSRALFEYMVAERYYKKYKLVWLVNEPSVYKRYEVHPNIMFVSYQWEKQDKEEERKYFYFLFHAKYIFTTDAYGFMRNVKKEVKRVQLWHGCGIKTRVNFTSCENRYDYMTVISELYADIHADIYGLRKEQLLITGYPKQDWLFQPYPNGIFDLLKVKESKKYIFWLPTFRKAKVQMTHLKRTEYESNSATGLPIVNTMQQMKELDELLQQLKIMLIIKPHFLQGEKYCQNETYSNIFILEHDEMAKKDLILNRLLASADALISDYSSAAVDYMVLNRPIAFTLDDMDEYQNHRGFVFDNIAEWLPGMKIFDFEDFIGFVREVADGIDSSREIRERLLPEMHAYADQNNSQRVLEALGINKK